MILVVQFIHAKILLFLILLLYFSSPNQALALTNNNLISNPSVELKSGNWPADWSKYKTGNNISVFNYKTVGYEGKRSLYINVTQYKTGESYWYFKDVLVKPSTAYTYSEYYKSSMNTKFYLKVTSSLETQSISLLKEIPKKDIWSNLTIDFITPPDAKSVTAMHAASSLGFLYTDSFSLVPKDSGTYPSPTPSPTPSPKPPTPTPTPSSTLPTPTPIPDENPIPNSSVETVSAANPNLPEHWYHAKSGTNNAAFSYLTTGHAGNRSLKVNITSYTSGVAYYYFDKAVVTGSNTYDYSFYYKSDVYAEIDAAITLKSGEVVYQYLGVSYPSSNWSKFSTQIRMPDNAKEVSIYNMIYSNGYLITDDFALTQVNIQPFSRPIVTLTFDDFFNSLYDTIYPMFKKYGFTATTYVVTGDFNNPNILGADKLKELHNYGFEIGSHTVTHPHLPFISYDEVEYELSQSIIDIQNYIGITPKNFASPYGEYNDTVKDQIKKYYNSHRSVDVGFNTKDSFDRYNIKAMSSVVNTSPATVLGWVDQAIQDKAWLVIVYHDIIENGGTFTNTPEHLETVLQGLKSRGVRVMTTEAALNEILLQMSQ